MTPDSYHSPWPQNTTDNVLLEGSLRGFKTLNNFYVDAFKAQGLFQHLVSKEKPQNLRGLCFSELCAYFCMSHALIDIQWPHGADGILVHTQQGSWWETPADENPSRSSRMLWLGEPFGSRYRSLLLWNCRLRLCGLEPGSVWFLIAKQTGPCFTMWWFATASMVNQISALKANG